MATASARTLPTPPPVPSYQPTSPSKKDLALKPNPHPYAIKTTSTALLTRSNSSGYNVNATHHYYIPTSPSASRSDSAKGHRSTKSLNAVPESPTRESPRPLPIPPALDGPSNRRDGSGGSGGYVSADELSIAQRRPKRAETLSVIPMPSPALTAPSLAVDDLPENPKVWTPSQLAIYLTAALRMTSGGKPGEIEPIGLPALVAKDIAAFVKGARIGGRMFLRLNEEDLEALGMNKKWRDALLTAARNLRQNVLKGRIWGADTSPIPSPSPQFASGPSQIFSDPQLNSSSSSIESSSSLSAEEAGEEDVLGAALGRSKARRYRNGRVKGMVATFERSGSFSSDGGFDDSQGGLTEERTSPRRWIRQHVQLVGGSQRVVESPSPTRRRPLPVPPSPSGSSNTGTMVTADEEPTMEALLAEVADSQPVTGARAWEEMDLANGVTVKHISSNGATHVYVRTEPAAETLLGTKTITGLGSGRSSGGSSNGKGSERRVVTAIFAPVAADSTHPEPLKPLESTNGLNTFAVGDISTSIPPDEQPKPRPLPPTPASPPDGAEEAVPEEVGLDADTIQLERLLEEELVATRALVDTFRARLEIVEQKVADLEMREALRDAEERVRSTSAPVASAASVIASTLAPQLSHSDTETQTQGEIEDVYRTRESAEIGVQSSTGAVAVADACIQSDDDGGEGVSPASSPELVGPTSGPVAKKADKEEGEDKPSHVADLPSYVLLVGLGVCAIVTQVVFRKVFGKGVWRP